MTKQKSITKVILAVVIAVLVTAAGIVTISFTRQRKSCAQQISLGRKYMESEDYSGAIQAFNEALSIDPSNMDAVSNIAIAYNASGNPDFALKVLDTYVSGTSTPELEQVRAQIQREQGSLEEAIHTTEYLIQLTDEEVYYTQLQQLLAELLSQPVLYGASDVNEALVAGGALSVCGSNRSGQLGMQDPLVDTSDYQNAEFPAKAESVFCGKQDTYVIDSDGKTWVAGSNRSSQAGRGGSTIMEQRGWNEMADLPGGVARVAAGNAFTLYLCKDGSVWKCGQDITGQNAWNGRPVRDTVVERAMQIGAQNNTAAVLSTGGDLYLTTNSGNGWTRVAVDVAMFSFWNGDGAVSWLTTDGRIGSYNTDYRSFAFPIEGISFDSMLVRYTGTERAIICQEKNGALWLVNSSGKTPLECTGKVQSLTSFGDTGVITFADETVQFVSLN